MFVLDCSVTMAWLFEDERTDFCEKVLDALEKKKAIVPSLWCLEVTNVLLQAEKRKRCTNAQSIQFLQTLSSLPIEIDDTPYKLRSESFLHLARSYELTSYDAAYLDIAIRLNCPLATVDTDLRKAMKRVGVELLDL